MFDFKPIESMFFNSGLYEEFNGAVLLTSIVAADRFEFGILKSLNLLSFIIP